MGKRVNVIAMALLCAAAFQCFSLEPVSKEINVDGLSHQISLGRLDEDPPHFVIQESVSNPTRDISRFSMTATFTEECALRTLVVVIVGAKSFLASGELEWLFPQGSRFNLYGKTSSKPDNEGMISQTLSFISGLSDFCSHASAVTEGAAVLKIYDRKGMTREFALPSEFFSLIADLKATVAYR